MVTNLATSKPSFFALFVTDFLLLLIMLAGLLRLRRRGGDTFELGRVLWRQVDWWFAGCDVVDPLMHFAFVRVSFGSPFPSSQNSCKL
jgi:hypothetical protein